MIPSRDYIVFDFETGSKNPHKAQPTPLAAVAIHGRKLTPQPGGFFNSEIRPILDDEKAIEMGLDPLEEEALSITRKDRKTLAKAPQPKQVWEKFVKFVNKYNFKKTQWFAPIPVGYNIINYDMIIIQRLCEQFGPVDKNGNQALFHKIHKVDVLDLAYGWLESNPNVKSMSMDSMRDFLSLETENAHDALQDVKDTANIFIRFWKHQRRNGSKTKFEKAFADGTLYV